MEWQPYKVGDRLEFKSNRNESYTIVIEKISRHHSVTDPLDIIPDKTEDLSVFGKYSLINPWVSTIGDSVFHKDTELLHMSSGIERSNLYLKLIIEDSWFYGDSWLDISELEKKSCIDSFGFNDLLVFEDKIGEYKHRDNHIERFYWSKEFGYIRYELKDGYFWELNRFIRNDKDRIIKNGS
jgi:hypothetical protein